MSFIRFSPAEYQAISHICRPIKLERKPLHALKKIIVQSLAGTMPELAERIGRYRWYELRILQDYLLEQRRPNVHHGLSADELGMLSEAFGPFLFQVRYLSALRRALVQHFQSIFPALAKKLGSLSNRQFEGLCDQYQGASQKGFLRAARLLASALNP